jgi:hypothetical protein
MADDNNFLLRIKLPGDLWNLPHWHQPGAGQLANGKLPGFTDIQ